MIFQWISCLINAAARWYRHSYQHQRENQMVRTELRYAESVSESKLEQLCGHQHKNRTHAVDISTDTSIYQRRWDSTSLSFPIYFPWRSRPKVDIESIYHFLITLVFRLPGESRDLFIYALIHSGLSDFRATYGLFLKPFGSFAGILQ